MLLMFIFSIPTYLQQPHMTGILMIHQGSEKLSVLLNVKLSVMLAVNLKVKQD